MAEPKKDGKNTELSAVEKKIIARKVAKAWNDKFNKGSSVTRTEIGAKEFQQLANSDKSYEAVYLKHALKVSHDKGLSHWDDEILKALDPLVSSITLEENVKDYHNTIALAFKTYSQNYLGVEDKNKLKRISPSTTKVFNVFDIIAFDKKKSLPNPSDLGIKSLKDSVTSLSLEGAKKLVELLK